MYKEKNTHLGSYQLLMHSWILYSDPEAQVHRKKAGGFRGQLFSEGLIMVQCSNMDCLFYTIVYEMFINFFRWKELNTDEIKQVAEALKINTACKHLNFCGIDFTSNSFDILLE